MKTKTFEKVIRGAIIGLGVLAGGILAKCVHVDDDDSEIELEEEIITSEDGIEETEE